MSTTARTKRPTIRDVAAKAGVSKSLVSLVFSAPQTVSNYRKELVLKAADELGFSPSFLARSLATETGTFIGILVADLHNPLFAQIVDQVRVALEAEGEYSFMTSAMLLNSQGEQILDSKTVSALIDLRPKSVLVVGSIPDLHRLASLPESVDIVIASAISKDIARATTVRSNDEIGMRLLIEHLVENGHQKISHISVEAGDVSKSRRSAYESVMKEKGLAKFINVEFAKSAASKGYKVIIAGAGGAAHLPGMVAALTTLPVIGVPVSLKNLDGMDSLLSIVQMPGGIPVATVGIDNAKNAGILAARIIGSSDAALSKKIEAQLSELTDEAKAKGAQLSARRNTKTGF